MWISGGWVAVAAASRSAARELSTSINMGHTLKAHTISVQRGAMDTVDNFVVFVLCLVGCCGEQHLRYRVSATACQLPRMSSSV